MLQSYRSTVFEKTGFTPYRLALGREMRLPVDLGPPLPEPPRDVRTFAAELAEDLEWSYTVAREIIGHAHKRAENRYNERLVERAYYLGSLVRVVHHARNRNVPSKLNTQYSGLCELTKVRGALLTLRELDTQRILTGNYNSVRRSTISRPAPPLVPALRAVSQTAPYFNDGRYKKLDEVVKYMWEFQTKKAGKPSSPTAAQTKDLIAYLDAL